MNTKNYCRRIRREQYENAHVYAFNAYEVLLGKQKLGPDIHKIDLLLGNNIKNFKKLWGQQSVCWNGEFRFWVWLHGLPNCNLYILTAPNKGTCYEVETIGDDVLAKQEVQMFITAMLKDLENLK